MTEIEVTVSEVRTQIAVAMRRYATISKEMADRGSGDPSIVLKELMQTVLPAVSDVLALVDRLEAHASWVSGELEGVVDRLDEDDNPGSQLVAEDAQALSDFIQAVADQCKGSLADLDPESQQARALKFMLDEATRLIKLVSDITLVDSDDSEETEDEGNSATEEAS